MKGGNRQHDALPWKKVALASAISLALSSGAGLVQAGQDLKAGETNCIVLGDAEWVRPETASQGVLTDVNLEGLGAVGQTLFAVPSAGPERAAADAPYLFSVDAGVSWSPACPWEQGVTPVPMYDVFENGVFSISVGGAGTILVGRNSVCNPATSISPSIGDGDFYGVATDGDGGFIAVGIDGTRASPTIYRSGDDGVNWTRVYFGGSAPLGAAEGVAYDGERFVAVGGVVSGLTIIGWVATSPNGAVGTWTVRAGGPDLQNDLAGLNAVAVMPKPSMGPVTAKALVEDATESRWVAVGNGGAIYTSDDGGVTWTAQVSPVTASLRGVYWDETSERFVAVGDNSVIVTSPDGVVWTSEAPPIVGEGDGVPSPDPVTLYDVVNVAQPVENGCGQDNDNANVNILVAGGASALYAGDVDIATVARRFQDGVCLTKFATPLLDLTGESPQDTVDYRIEIENVGNATLGGGWRIEDTLPEGLKFGQNGASDITCALDDASGNVLCENDRDLLPGCTIDAAFTATTVDDFYFPNGEVLVNTALISADDFTDEEVTAETLVKAKEGSLSLFKDCQAGLLLGDDWNGPILPAQTVVYPGDIMTCKIAVANIVAGTRATADVTETYPPGFRFVDAVPVPNDGTDNQWTLDLEGPVGEGDDVGESILVALQLSATARAGTLLTNQVDSVLRDCTVEDPSDCTATAFDTVVVGSSDLALGLTKTDRVDPVKPGDIVTYDISWSNGMASAQDATDCVLTENYPAGWTFVSAVPPPDADKDNVWTLGTLPKGAAGSAVVRLLAPEDAETGQVGVNFVGLSCFEGGVSASQSTAIDADVPTPDVRTMGLSLEPGIAGSTNMLTASNGFGNARTEFLYGLGFNNPGTVMSCDEAEYLVEQRRVAAVKTSDAEGTASAPAFAPRVFRGRDVWAIAVQLDADENGSCAIGQGTWRLQ